MDICARDDRVILAALALFCSKQGLNLFAKFAAIFLTLHLLKENICIQEIFILLLTFNPGLTLPDSRTTWPRLQQVKVAL